MAPKSKSRVVQSKTRDSPKPDESKTRIPKPSDIPLENPFIGLAKTFAVLGPLSLVRYAYGVALEPLYGSTPTNLLINKITMGGVALAAITPGLSSRTAFLLAGVLLSAAPNSVYWAGVRTARFGDPFWGPAAVHVAVFVPIIFVFTNFVVGITAKANPSGATIIDRLRAGTMVYFFMTLQSLWAEAPYVNTLSSSDIFLYVSGAAFVGWVAEVAGSTLASTEGSSSGVTRPKLLVPSTLVSLWFLLFPFLRSPVGNLELPYTHPTYPLRILSSVQSVTGLIVVGEALPPDPGSTLEIKDEMHSLRYLRASHSLLGGVWTGDKIATIGNAPPLVDEAGTPLGDSIYSTFVLQEAARLVNSTSEGNQRKWDNALIIGLGAGISANGFARHGISTTIVEIDPAVYDASRRFFGLPEIAPEKVFLEDARGWVSQRRDLSIAGQLLVEDKYDIVVHDCFSGGGVPEQLFTLEFWQDLKTIVHPAGVVVINFAGMLGSDSSRSILFTLEKSFSQCRAFHDAFEEMTEEKYQTDFINMVFFCTLSTNPITFRSARPEDFLDSYMRRHLLSSLALREVDFGFVIGDVDVQGREKYVLTDQRNSLGKSQEKDSLHHWQLMRQVLPEVFWETY